MRAHHCTLSLAMALLCFTAATHVPAGATVTLRSAVDSLLAQPDALRMAGDVLFREDFEGSLDRWRPDAGWSLRDRPGGAGRCAAVTAGDDHEDLIAKERIPVTPGHPVVVVWRTRTVSGDALLLLRVDFFDADGKQGTPYARQDVGRAGRQWTTNAILVSGWFPDYTRAITIHFHHEPKVGTTTLLDDVYVVDLARAAAKMVAGELTRTLALAKQAAPLPRTPAARAWRGLFAGPLKRARAELAACARMDPADPALPAAADRPALVVRRYADAADALRRRSLATTRVLVYATKPVTGTMITPTTAELPGRIAAEAAISACPGESEPASLVLWAPDAVSGLSLAATDLRGPGGASIPAANVDLKWVKCWYQAGTAWTGISQDRSHKVLTPELLLNDDTLVKVDGAGQHNSLKLSFPQGPRYVPVDDPKPVAWGARFGLSEYPVQDAPRLRPIDLPAGENRQAWVTVRVPEGGRPGRYAGKIRLRAGGKQIGAIGLAVQVLPFRLEPPRTHYDLSRPFTCSLYYWGELDPDGAGGIGYKLKSERQFRAELKAMYDHGIVAPVMIWSPDIVYRNEPLFRKHLAIAREIGMAGRPLHFGDSGMIGSPADAAALEALQENVRRTVSIAKEYGFTEVYFYGLDEATGDRLLSQRRAWQAVHEAGGKVIVSGYRGQLDAVGDLLDLFNWAGPLDPQQPVEWHKRGQRIWNYANPQTPVENPEAYRRNYGLLLWKTDYDGGCTYCFMDSSGTQWNDFDDDTYRDHCVAYPTVDGVVGTLALEGFREAADDLKYATTLRLAIEKALKGGSPGVKAKATAALAWLERIDPATADLDATRRQMIRHILALEGSGAPRSQLVVNCREWAAGSGPRFPTAGVDTLPGAPPTERTWA